MAIDTAAKRFSAAHVLSPWRGLNYFPTGTVSQAERQAVIYLYSGILAVAPVSVPNVVGETQAQATTDIQAVGLVVSVSTAYSASVAAGLVISQNPVGGTLVSAGSTVSIVVSLGPQPVAAEQPAGRKRQVRNIYRITVDGQSFEFKSLADAITFLERAKATAQALALETRRQAAELQAKQQAQVKPTAPAMPKIEASSRDLRSAVTETKREIAKIYRQAQIDMEIAILFELADRERHNEESIWWLM